MQAQPNRHNDREREGEFSFTLLEQSFNDLCSFFFLFFFFSRRRRKKSEGNKKGGLSG